MTLNSSEEISVAFKAVSQLACETIGKYLQTRVDILLSSIQESLCSRRTES